MTAVLVAALVAGLAGAPHCFGMCGGFAAACATDTSSAVAWHAGRLSTYAVLGAVAGAFGAAIPGPTWLSPAIAVVLLMWFAAGLAGLVRPLHASIPGLARLGTALLGRNGWAPRFAFGVVSGLLPCGLVYSALSLALATGSPANSAGVMLAFGVGTLPALAFAAIGVRRLLGLGVWARRLFAIGVLAAGLFAIGTRASVQPETESCHQH